jgi:alkyl hydroperoxide reductase subunit AhpF
VNHEVRVVAAQGERMAQELSNDIDQYSIDLSKQKRAEVAHG